MHEGSSSRLTLPGEIMTQIRKTVTPEICKAIASAIVERWVYSDEDHKRVMELVFKTDARTAAADLSEELYRLVEDEYYGFFRDLIIDLLPHIEKEIEGLYFLFKDSNKELFEKIEEKICLV